MSAELRRRPFVPTLFASLGREVALTVLDLSRGERALEVGVGRGETFLKIATLVGPQGRAAGTDPREEQIRVCEARLREVRYENFDLFRAEPTTLPFPGSSFDAVYAAYVLDALDGNETGRALAEIRRVLKVGGRAALCGVTAGERPLTRALSAGWDALYRISPALTARSHPRRLRDLAVRAGFEVDRRLYVEKRLVPSEVLLVRRPGALPVTP